MLSMKKDAIEFSPKWVSAIYFLTTICGLELQGSKQSKDFCST
jgi:hypothetical protein